MMPYLHEFAVLVFAAVMAVAAFEDFRRYVIPNQLTAALCALWPLYFIATDPSWYAGAAAIGCAAAVFFVGAVLFARGYLGGGDVKLLAAATLWAGPHGTLSLLMLTSALGGALALFLLLPFGRQMTAAARGLLGQPPVQAERSLSMPVPYGIAIAAAALIVTLPPYLG